MDRILGVVAVLGVAVLAYLYGFASDRYDLFPSKFVADGIVATKAFSELWAEDDMPPGFLKLEPASTPRGVEATQNQAAQADGLILVAGGPYRLMDKCPELGCLAWLMNRSGEVVYAWPVRENQPWAKFEHMQGQPRPDRIYPVGVHAFDNGDLAVSFQSKGTFPFGVGIAKVDKDGNTIWKHENFAHHWFDVGDDGRIYTPTQKLIPNPHKLGDTPISLNCESRMIYDDHVTIIAPDGTIETEFSVLDAMVDSGYVGLIERTRSQCDPLHLNDVRILKAADAAEYPTLQAGDLLVSMNTINTAAVLDGTTHKVKWITSGHTVGQHNPRYGGNNKILLLDNRGGSAAGGGTRIVAVDVATDSIETIFPGPSTPKGLNYHTEVGGHFDLDADRKAALFSIGAAGSIVEIEFGSGNVLWKYNNVFDMEPFMRAKGTKLDPTFARFAVSSSYHTGDLPFLQK